MEKKKAEFDADYSPKNPQNVQAAKDHDLTFDRKTKAYRDEDGGIVRDKFGQRI